MGGINEPFRAALMVVPEDWDLLEAEVTHIYRWKNNEKRKGLYGRECVVLVRGLMNSVLVEFENGDKEVVSRFAVRRLK